MKIGHVRKYRKAEYTIGNLYLDFENGKGWQWFCNILEDTDRDLNFDGDLDDLGEKKIYGKTAIPYGIYDIKFKRSPSFKRIMPYISNIDGFSDVMYHYGNNANDTLGCPLLGLNTSVGRLTKSKETFEDFMKQLDMKKSYKTQIVKDFFDLK